MWTGAAKMLNRRAKKAMNGSKVLVLGVAYKQDIDDYRESPALRVIEELEHEGAQVTFFDPWVKINTKVRFARASHS